MIGWDIVLLFFLFLFAVLHAPREGCKELSLVICLQFCMPQGKMQRVESCHLFAVLHAPREGCRDESCHLLVFLSVNAYVKTENVQWGVQKAHSGDPLFWKNTSLHPTTSATIEKASRRPHRQTSHLQLGKALTCSSDRLLTSCVAGWVGRGWGGDTVWCVCVCDNILWLLAQALHATHGDAMRSSPGSRVVGEHRSYKRDRPECWSPDPLENRLVENIRKLRGKYDHVWSMTRGERQLFHTFGVPYMVVSISGGSPIAEW